MKTKKILATIGILLLIPVGLSQQTNNSFIPEPGITPDNPFYSLDKISERIELAVGSAPLIGSQELEAKIRANHAAERLAEAEKMIEKNKTEEAEKLFKEYSQQMKASEKRAGNSRVREKLENVTKRQTEKLEQIKEKVPEQARKGIQTAIEANKNRMKRNLPGRPEKPGAQKRDPDAEINPNAGRDSGKETPEETTPGTENTPSGNPDNSSNDSIPDQPKGPESGQESRPSESPNGSSEAVPDSGLASY